MAVDSIQHWLNDFCNDQRIVYFKRLSGNDTQATHSHQAGLYLPNWLAFALAPALDDRQREDPDCLFPAFLDSHNQHPELRLVWYNNRFTLGKTRNECRITRWGGASSPMLDPENTGAIVLMSFPLGEPVAPSECRVWVCRNLAEEDAVEERLGQVHPGEPRVLSEGGGFLPLLDGKRLADCSLSTDEIPPAWLERMPSGAEFAAEAVQRRPLAGRTPDERLISRHDCEYSIYQSVEAEFYARDLEGGFKSLDSFLAVAQRILQSRRSRAGRSVELQTRTILEEEGLKRDFSYSYQAEIEGGKKPDFLFPSESLYGDHAFDASRLRILAVKRTVKDRWRQVIDEADRVGRKHLLTLQEGVSERQFGQMESAGVVLVVPKPLHSKYPVSVRSSLVTLAGFIAEVAGLRD